MWRWKRGCGLLTTLLHPGAASRAAQELKRHRSVVTYYFGHKITEVEAVFGHYRSQDLGDGLGRFGFQPHRAVNGDQVQPESKPGVNDL